MPSSCRGTWLLPLGAPTRYAARMAIEREIKLRFETADDARARILSPAVGATPLRCRRLQEDSLLDTPDGQLFRRGVALRVRIESGRSLLTFKGPVQPGPLKLREEHETVVGDGHTTLTILRELGLEVWFRYEKYREEFVAGDAVIAVDETPIGVFVEIESTEEGLIHETAAALGKGPDEYVKASYRSLFVEHCERCALPAADMLFS